MSWDDLSYVLALSRAGSLGEAARNLGVAHTTVSRRISALEEAHGVKLFEKTPTGYVPTEAGRELAVAAESVEERVLDAERRLAGHVEVVSGEVALSVPEALGPLVCSLAAAFRETYPSVVLNLDATSDRADLARREADVVVRAAAAPPEMLIGRRLTTVEFAVYAAAAAVRRAAAPASWVVFDSQQQKSPQGRWELSQVPQQQVAVRVRSRGLFLEAVKSGLGQGVLPCALGDADPQLARLGEPISELSCPLWILTHADLKDVPRVAAVMVFFAARLSGAAQAQIA
jgi:DNA-binding transcriptional LysR family regulator